MKRFQQPRFPTTLYCDLAEQPVCPCCHQIIDPRKIKSTFKERAMPQEITGFCVLTMQDGTIHQVPNQKVFDLLGKAQRISGAGPIPSWVYVKYPALGWFKNAVSVTSDDGSRIHELLACLIAGPVTTETKVS